MPARRQSRAKKSTLSMLPRAALHQIQFPAMPSVATMPATASGVSAANVVATIDVPASHQGSSRPARKYCPRLSPARGAARAATTNGKTRQAARMSQSSVVSVIGSRGYAPNATRALAGIPKPAPRPRGALCAPWLPSQSRTSTRLSCRVASRPNPLVLRRRRHGRRGAPRGSHRWSGWGGHGWSAARRRDPGSGRSTVRCR